MITFPCINLVLLSQVIATNISVAREMVHSMFRIKGKKVFISITVNLEEIYDQLNKLEGMMQTKNRWWVGWVGWVIRDCN